MQVYIKKWKEEEKERKIEKKLKPRTQAYWKLRDKQQGLPNLEIPHFFPDKLKSLADEEKCFVSDIY